ncbi:MAG TPA: M24 family metallopeptidase [Solirubrobacteraceae bacterium]|nr:M24 family metallopeptidase [Solirubrobacteraceae bacterium]
MPDAGRKDALLLYGAPDASPDLFHAIPEGIVDPFLYLESDGRRAATVGVLDADKVRAHEVDILDPSSLGADDLIAQGVTRTALAVEVALRGCRAAGVSRGVVPPDFPVAVADHLRAGGVELLVDEEIFVARRRAKTPAQLAGVRRAQKAADAAMATAAELIRGFEAGVSSERIRSAMQEVCDRMGCDLPDDVIVSHGPQSAVGHESGHGELLRGEPVVVDIWPRDRRSRCWADMTRTFVAGGGEPPDELAEYWRLCRESLDLVYPEVRAGADCKALFARSCEPFHAAGKPTQLTKEPGTVLADGYFHSLGHGVGLEIHERPHLGRAPDTLQAGDVVSLEPGCYRQGFGGCRLEDLVIVTNEGCEVLTDFPYDL